MCGVISAPLSLDKRPGLILGNGSCVLNFLFVLWLYRVEFSRRGARVPGSQAPGPRQAPSFLYWPGFSHSGIVGGITLWLSLLLPGTTDIHLLWEACLSKGFAHFIEF